MKDFNLLHLIALAMILTAVVLIVASVTGR